MGPPSTPDLLLIIVCQAYEFPDPSGPGISKISDSGPERNACESSLIVFIPHLECEKTGLKSYKSETQVGCWNPQQPSCLFSPTHSSSLRSSQFPLLTLRLKWAVFDAFCGELGRPKVTRGKKFKYPLKQPKFELNFGPFWPCQTLDPFDTGL